MPRSPVRGSSVLVQRQAVRQRGSRSASPPASTATAQASRKRTKRPATGTLSAQYEATKSRARIAPAALRRVPDEPEDQNLAVAALELCRKWSGPADRARDAEARYAARMNAAMRIRVKSSIAVAVGIGLELLGSKLEIRQQRIGVATEDRATAECGSPCGRRSRVPGDAPSSRTRRIGSSTFGPGRQAPHGSMQFEGHRPDRGLRCAQHDAAPFFGPLRRVVIFG